MKTRKKIKLLTPFDVRKTLAESIILSRINYGIVLYKSSPVYLIKRIQRLQNAAVVHVLMHYSNEKYVISLNWLPIIELIGSKIWKLTYKALSHGQIIYHWIEKTNIREMFRNNDCNMMEKSKEDQTFHDDAEKVFNKIPLSIREKSYYKIFCNMTKKFFNGKGLKRFIYLGIIVMWKLHITLIFSLCPFEVTLPYKCFWYIIWITFLSDSDNCF